MTLDEMTARRMGFPPAAPQPVPGCGECVRLDRERARAQSSGDYSRVSDCNVRLRTHEHQ